MRANVNKPSDANICQANDSYKVKSMPVKSISSETDRYDAIFVARLLSTLRRTNQGRAGSE